MLPQFAVRLLRPFAICFLLVLACAASATPTSDLRFKRLGSLEADELSILSLLQDRQGFIWIGTHSGGLYRYNGYQAVKFTHDADKPRSLPNDRVAALFEDKQGRIWAGTQDGLARFNPETGDFTRLELPPGPSSQQIVKVLLGDGGNGMWVATWGGLLHVDTTSGEVTRHVHDQHDPLSLGSNDVNALALDERGGLWATTWPGGLDYLAPGAKGFVHLRVDSAEARDDKLNIVRSLYYAPDRTLWIGTETGVVKWNTAQDWSTRHRIDSPPTRVNALYGDSDGAVWAGTMAAGLLRYDRASERPVRYSHRANDPHSLQSDHIRAVMQDRGGMLWIASFTDGLSLVNLKSQGFQRFIPFDAATDNTLPNNSVQNLAGAPGGRLWLGSNTGLSLFDPASGEVVKTYRGAPKRPGALSNDVVYSLYQQPDGPLWVGTSAGLNRLNQPDGPFRTIHFGGVASDFINTIAPGANGKLWLGTALQVIGYDIASGGWTNYAHNPALPTSRSVNSTTCIVEDSLGRVWMGSDTSGGGLDLLDPATGRFRHFLHDPANPASLSDNNVSTLYQDPAGRMWAGTAKGVNQVITGNDGSITFRAYQAKDSVGAVKILAMRSDRAGQLWLSTAAGLVRLDPASGKVVRYSTSDGLSEGFAIGAAYAAPDGVLYFSGVKGMTGVHPDMVRSVSVAPRVAITDITVFNRSLSEGMQNADIRLSGTVTSPTEVALSVQESVFSLEFSALHYTDPGRNSYAHRLTGFDRDWVITDANHRTATYTNLDPGTYIFEVKAANEQGLWSEQAASLRIRILPPFWQTWWFRLVMGAMAVSLLGTAYHARVRSLTRRQSHLQALVAARTGELEESNAKLATLSNTDALTSITNRRGFDEALASEWRRAKRNGHSLALAMLDVDHFKSYNDFYGHQAGDQALRAVAELIDAFARRTSDLAARYGGEEFALLAPVTDAADALALAQSICLALERQALPHAKSPHAVITISIGVAALVPTEANDACDLVQAADQALYRAKQEGRNRAALPIAGAPAGRQLEAADTAG